VEELLDFVKDFIASIKERQDALRQATRHVLRRVAKFINVDGGICENEYPTRNKKKEG